MDSRRTVLWLDGWAATRPKALVRTLYWAEGSVETVNEPLASVRKRRAFEPSTAIFASYSSRSLKLRRLPLGDLYPVSLSRVLPASFGTLRDSGHVVFRADHRGSRLLIPAVLLIEALFLYSSSVTRQITVPGSADLYVGHVAPSNQIAVNRALIGRTRNTTTLRRLAWMAQCEDARRSWSSVLTYAHQGRLSLDPPEARLSGWAWGIELPAGLLVADFNGLTVDFNLPHPEATLRVGTSTVPIPPPAQRSKGFPSFL
jgi:hypothetical protein